MSYQGNEHRTDNARTYPENVRYYTEKWGGFIGKERYRTPFGLELPADYWRLDRRRLAAGTWRG